MPFLLPSLCGPWVVQDRCGGPTVLATRRTTKCGCIAQTTWKGSHPIFNLRERSRTGWSPELMMWCTGLNGILGQNWL
jgi:hypothetical protein